MRSGELADLVRAARTGLELAAYHLDNAANAFEKLPDLELERMFVTFPTSKALVACLRAEAQGIRSSAADLTRKGPEMIQRQAMEE